MSRLIRNDPANRPKTADITPTTPLTSDSIVAHLRRCQAIASDQARAAFQIYLRNLDEAFSQDMDRAKSNQEVSELSGIQRLFRRNHQELERYYCGYIAEGFVKFKKKELRTELQTSAGGELSLVDNDELEETIALSSMIQKVDVFYAEPIWALNQRFAILNGGEQVTEATNPAAPIQLCESLRRALRLIPLTSKTKITAHKVYEQGLGNLVKSVIDDTNEYLKQAGVLPNLRYTPTRATPSPTQPGTGSRATGTSDFGADGVPSMGFGPVPAPDPSQPSEQYQSALLHAIRSLQTTMRAGQPAAPAGSVLAGAMPAGGFQQAGGIRIAMRDNPFAAFVPGTGSVGAPGMVISADQLLAAIHQVQGQAAGVVGSPLDTGTLPAVDLGQVLSALAQQFQQSATAKGGKVSNNDMHTIDLVGMVFEYMLKDENLPDSVKALLSYMHTPFLKLAFIDPGFFEQPEHPARMLLNSLAEAGIRWVGNDGTVQHDMYNKIKNIVDRVLRDFKNDVRVIAELLLEFNSYTKNIIRRQELMEKRATEKAQGEERLREVKLRVNEEVRRRTDNKELPSAVLLFALQPWSDYLSFALLRYGDKSEKWTNALAVVNDLLWIIEPKTDAADVVRQADLAPALLRDMETGFETIGYDQTKGRKLLETLSSLIEMAQQSKKAEPAPAPMRDKLEKIAAEKAGQAEFEATDISKEEEKIVENLKLIEFGTWFEFEGGKRLKIAWYNARTSHYMLVDQMGKKVAMMSGLEIAREMIAKRAKIIAGSSKPFFERALENIFQKLNAQAEAQTGGPHRDPQ
jgi:hypothetical protein